MKRAMPRMPIWRLPIRKAPRNCGQFCYGRKPRLTAACNLQMLAARSLQIATSSAFASIGKLMISRPNSWHQGCARVLAYDSTFRSDQMADVIFIVITVVFFLISWWYVKGCDRL
jgi:hypothetical protein